MWGRVPGQSLSHRSWDGETVLFNDLSGDTHLLDADALALLLVLQESPQDVAALAQRLAPGDHEGATVIAAMLGDLAAIHLVAPLAP